MNWRDRLRLTTGKCLISEGEKCWKWCRPILNVHVETPETAQCNFAQSTSADDYDFMVSIARPPALCVKQTRYALGAQGSHKHIFVPSPLNIGVHKLFGQFRRVTTRSGTDRNSTPAWPLCFLLYQTPGVLITLPRCEVRNWLLFLIYEYLSFRASRVCNI